jgi:FkbM family methyltransferase
MTLLSRTKRSVADFLERRGVVQLGLGRFGLIAGARLENYPLALHLFRLFTHFSVDCVLDVGANVGQYRDLLRRVVGYRGRIVSYEPLQRNYDTLVERAKADPLWTIERCALGQPAGTADIHVTSSTDFSSFLLPNNDRAPEYGNMNRVSAVETVPTMTLDDAFRSVHERFRPRSVYLKMDTQGFDLTVARSGPEALAAIVALQSEAAVVPLYAGMPGYAETLRFFEHEGFAISGVFPVTVRQSMELLEFDCVMIRPPARSPTA